MTYTQKILAFRLAVVLLGMLGWAVAFYYWQDLERAKSLWAIYALILLEKRIFGAPRVDERDQSIVRRADLFAYRVFWILSVLVCISAPYFLGVQTMIESIWLAYIPWFGAFILLSARSIIGLTFYARGA